MRSKRASEVWTSRPTPSSDPTGKKRRACSVVKATMVAIESVWLSTVPPSQ